MRIKRLEPHPEHSHEGWTEHFGSVWEVELERGEATEPYEHPHLEEIYCCVEGEGQIYVATKRHQLQRGEMFFVPRSTSRWLENPSSSVLRCLYVESPLRGVIEAASAAAGGPSAPAAPGDAGDPGAGAASATDVGATIPEAMSELQQKIDALPSTMNQAEAIQQIVYLFDAAGRLSELIEGAFGLDNQQGLGALTRIERRIMDAVVEITRRYRRSNDLGLDLDLKGFGGRLKDL